MTGGVTGGVAGGVSGGVTGGVSAIGFLLCVVVGLNRRTHRPHRVGVVARETVELRHQPAALLVDQLGEHDVQRPRLVIDKRAFRNLCLGGVERVAAAGGELRRAPDPCAMPKACKNDVELAGTRAAHQRDGAALTRFLCWFAKSAPEDGLTEMAAAKRLYALRAENEHYRGPSFSTIAGAGPNGAIVHYRVSRASNRKLEPGSLYLVDSGAQYVDGTTDVTRTIAVGAPAEAMRRHFTLVLKGHIGVATARFPKGTRGQDLDPFARRPLWQAGLDFDHGVGHGVGSYLSVHEGPQRISRLGPVPLEPGMICSNEPGYYREGDYGIRIENLELVTDLEKIEGGEREMMGFETLTLAPIDRRLIDTTMLTRDELDWLNLYHDRVRETVGPLVDEQTRKWLESATAPLA